jgi:DNA-binding response OmpR family regulator
MHIALLEDDDDQRGLYELWLTGAAHSVRGFASAAAILDALRHERFDLLLLDWMLPVASGGEVLSWARQSLGWELPVVVVTAREDEETVVAALKAGADDYVVKPLKQFELLARLEAVARRVRHAGLPVIRVGAYEIDVQSLSMQGEPVTLTQKEFDLATYLFQSPGKLLSRDHLLNKIWGINVEVDTRTVDTHVSRLRKKLRLDGSLGWRMVPVYGYGYRFERVDAAAEGAAEA